MKTMKSMKNRTILRFTAVIFVMVLQGVTSVGAQSSGRIPIAQFRSHSEFRQENSTDHSSRSDSGNRRKAHEMMMTLKIWKLTDTLEIDEVLSGRLFPRIRELESLRFEQHRDLIKLNNQLHLLFHDAEHNVDRMTELTRRLLNLKVEHAIAEREMLEKVFELLSPEQQAGFMLVEAEFHQSMRRFLHERKRAGRNRKEMPDNLETP